MVIGGAGASIKSTEDVICLALGACGGGSGALGAGRGTWETIS